MEPPDVPRLLKSREMLLHVYEEGPLFAQDHQKQVHISVVRLCAIHRDNPGSAKGSSIGTIQTFLRTMANKIVRSPVRGRNVRRLPPGGVVEPEWLPGPSRVHTLHSPRLSPFGLLFYEIS